MNHLLMGTFDRTAANAITQLNVLVIPHATGVLAVVTNESRKALTHLRGLRMQPLQPRNDVLYFTGAQILGDLVHPAVRLRRTVAVAQAGIAPGVFQCVPEVENLAPPNE